MYHTSTTPATITSRITRPPSLTLSCTCLACSASCSGGRILLTLIAHVPYRHPSPPCSCRRLLSTGPAAAAASRAASSARVTVRVEYCGA